MVLSPLGSYSGPPTATVPPACVYLPEPRCTPSLLQRDHTITKVSDTLLRYMPADPRFVPPAEALISARSWLAAQLPGADEVTSTGFEHIQFVDPDGNFEGV